MIGPYGNEERFDCYNDVLKESYQFEGKATISLATVVSQWTGSFHPETDANSGGKSYITWDDAKIQGFLNQATAREATFGNYDQGPGRLYGVLNEFSPKGLKCLVVGSAPNPWVESILLSYGATDI